MAEFNMDEYYSKGEKLYSDMATGADVFDPKHPDISMFDKEGQVTQAYTDASGWRGYGTRRMTPRRGHFVKKMMELNSTLSDEDQTIAKFHQYRYGLKPRYQKTDDGYNLATPYALEKEYRSKVEGMDPWEKSSFGLEFRQYMESMPTDTTSVERKVMDSMLKEDKASWQDIEDPVARLKARYKSR